MTISRLAGRSAVVWEFRSRPEDSRARLAPRVGHAHFWERAMSRGALLKGAAGVGGAVVTSGLLTPALARAGGHQTAAAPKPVPPNPALGGFHIYLPGENSEPSAIFDLNGFVGIATVAGKGTATLKDGSTQTLYFDVDNRFMKGEYVGLDGRMHHATFAFT
jgi:hypothetical protein